MQLLMVPLSWADRKLPKTIETLHLTVFCNGAANLQTNHCTELNSKHTWQYVPKTFMFSGDTKRYNDIPKVFKTQVL